jgi:hypothetical protein
VAGTSTSASDGHVVSENGVVSRSCRFSFGPDKATSDRACGVLHRVPGPFSLDHLLVASRRQLESVLCDYVRHYNQARPHRGLHLDVPEPSSRAGQAGTVRRRDVLGGIIHEYERAA